VAAVRGAFDDTTLSDWQVERAVFRAAEDLTLAFYQLGGFAAPERSYLEMLDRMPEEVAARLEKQALLEEQS